MDDLLHGFLSDAREIVDSTEAIVVRFDADGGCLDADPLHRLFRGYHTLKGTAGFFELQHLVSVTHAAEDLLDLLREQPALLNRDDLRRRTVELMLSVGDFLRRLIDHIAEHGNDADFAAEAKTFTEPLRDLVHDARRPADADPQSSGAEKAAVIEAKPATEAMPEEAEHGASFGLFDETAPTAEGPAADAAISSTEARKSDRSHKDIRISVDRIDRLVDSTGELTIIESMIRRSVQSMNGTADHELRNAAGQLRSLVRNLQEIALGMRMIPLVGVFRKVERLVSDLRRRSGKNVVLETYGSDTELDKSVSEAVADPLMHILRNAVDHGIESPQERADAGKAGEGRIVLEARHAGSEVWISVQDDGRGLDREKILERARERGLIDVAMRTAELSDEEVWDFIFEPGFSTAESITHMSGRGVGMDVVRKNVHALRGRVEVRAEPGGGTRFLLRIPLTLSIIDGMIMEIDGSFFVLPTIDIHRSLAVSEKTEREALPGGDVLHVDGRLVRTLALRSAFRFGVATREDRDHPLAVIIEQEGRYLALYVDRIIGNQSVVIKPLPEYMRGVRGLAGCTILGDGEVAFIFDVQDLLRRFAATAADRRHLGAAT